MVSPATINTYEVEPEPGVCLLVEEDVNELTVEEMIVETFPEKPELMKRVAKCESGMRQFLDNGEPVQGPTNDWGLFQIHAPSWNEEALNSGLDYKYSLEENIAMARIVYDEQGISAWNPSRHCWGS